jgi:hypothetical protein
MKDLQALFIGRSHLFVFIPERDAREKPEQVSRAEKSSVH